MTLKEQIYIVCKAAAAMPSSIFLIQRQEEIGEKKTHKTNTGSHSVHRVQNKKLFPQSLVKLMLYE